MGMIAKATNRTSFTSFKENHRKDLANIRYFAFAV